jgi:hypothetical protein
VTFSRGQAEFGRSVHLTLSDVLHLPLDDFAREAGMDLERLKGLMAGIIEAEPGELAHIADVLGDLLMGTRTVTAFH